MSAIVCVGFLQVEVLSNSSKFQLQTAYYVSLRSAFDVA
jgi:hypothetical protein